MLALIWIDAIPYVCAGLGGLSLIIGLSYKKLFPRREAPEPEGTSFAARMEAMRRKRDRAHRRLDAEIRERALKDLEAEESERAQLEEEQQAAASAAEYEADQERIKNFDVFRSLLAEAQASAGDEDAEVEIKPSLRSTGGPLGRLLVQLGRAEGDEWTESLEALRELILLTEDLCDLLEMGRGEVAWRPEIRRAWDARLTALAHLEEDLFPAQNSEESS